MKLTEDRTWWVVETARTTYWDGRETGCDAHFTDDIDMAMRFARFDDAERARCWLLKPLANTLRSVEHGYIAKTEAGRD